MYLVFDSINLLYTCIFRNMELIRGEHNLRPKHRGCVATIGNFDGVHLGHQTVLGQVATKAAELNLPSQVIIFEPLPREFFMARRAPARLTRFREKVQALQRFSVDRLLCLHFNRTLAEMPAQRFIERILVQGLAIRYLVVGDDFRFGKNRQGNFSVLRASGRQHGFTVAHMHTFEVDAERVSSTRIRTALQNGQLSVAEKLLGRPYRMSGRVVHGDKLGKKIGFPTANIQLGRRVSPIKGVFAVEVFGLNAEPMYAVANVGNRPTVRGQEYRLEAHILDFERDIYGQQVHADFLHKIRDEVKFDSIDALKRQIEADASAARAFFKRERHRLQTRPRP